ncbi:MAG TPA: hypothetical protein VGN16_15280 [Acidobacteriaceae bacterium]|jgi:hypothetical protein
MRFRPRHYLLIAVILALGIYRMVQIHRARTLVTPVAVEPSGPKPASPAWTAFDKAAALRDAPDTQFKPALQDLLQTLAASKDETVSEVEGCETWLEFYRGGTMTSSGGPSAKQRSTQHLDACTRLHHDTD